MRNLKEGRILVTWAAVSKVHYPLQKQAKRQEGLQVSAKIVRISFNYIHN